MGRQELNRYKANYSNTRGDNKTTCSYCGHYIEDEIHLYIDCDTSGTFWEDAEEWYQAAFGVAPPLLLNGPKLFGMENEPPDDLFNIFYRSARYCIYVGRKRSTTLRIQVFTALVRDELKLKYAGNRILKYSENPVETRAINWLNVQGLQKRGAKRVCWKRTLM